MPRTPRHTAALLAAILFAIGFSLHLVVAVMLWRARAAYGGGCACYQCHEFYFHGVGAFGRPEAPLWGIFHLPHDNILGQPVYTLSVIGKMVLLPAAASAAAWLGIAALSPLRDLRRPTKERAGRCPQCGYDITALRGTTCPECGADCDAQLTAFRADEAIDRLRRRVLPPANDRAAAPRCITCGAAIDTDAQRCAICSSRFRHPGPRDTTT